MLEPQQLTWLSSLDNLAGGQIRCKEVLGLTFYKFEILLRGCCDNKILSMKYVEEKKFA